MYLQSLKSVKHNAAKPVNQVNFKESRHIGFGVFIVHSFMLAPIECSKIPALAGRYGNPIPIRFL
jgi:hypothetical protein